MILALGARGPEFDSRNAPQQFVFSIEGWNLFFFFFKQMFRSHLYPFVPAIKILWTRSSFQVGCLRFFLSIERGMKFFFGVITFCSHELRQFDTFFFS